MTDKFRSTNPARNPNSFISPLTLVQRTWQVLHDGPEYNRMCIFLYGKFFHILSFLHVKLNSSPSFCSHLMSRNNYIALISGGWNLVPVIDPEFDLNTIFYLKNNYNYGIICINLSLLHHSYLYMKTNNYILLDPPIFLLMIKFDCVINWEIWPSPPFPFLC